VIVVSSAVVLRTQFPAFAQDRRVGLTWGLAAVLPVVAVLLVVGITVTQRAALKAAFLLPGAITTPDPQLLLLAFLIAVGLLGLARTGQDRVKMLVPIAVAVAGYGVIRVLRRIPEGPPAWTYYADKTLWLVVSCLVWVAFVPIVRSLAVEVAPRSRAAAVGVSARSFALGAAVLVLLGVGTPVAEPVGKAADGWYQPTAPLMSRTATAGDRSGNFLLWEWADPGSDRLANFWTGVIWGTDPSGLT
jgi:hypothetical protein